MEQRRKTVREVLIASRSVADCSLQVVAVGIYRDKVLLNFDPYLRPPDMNFIKKLSLSQPCEEDISSLDKLKGFKFIAYFFSLCPIKLGTSKANYFFSALAHLLSVGFPNFFCLWQFSIKSPALRQCLHLRQMFT